VLAGWPSASGGNGTQINADYLGKK